MIILPPLVEKTRPRPDRPLFEEVYKVPDIDSNKDFWDSIYANLRELNLYSPINKGIKQFINPLFGYFGFRVHPVTREPRYFHTGISIELESREPIYPVLSGILEYSGYGAVNGHYVLLSHPQIQTEDGYVLHSMYCHLKKPLVKFNSYQKMLREISLGSHPEIQISHKNVLGEASTSGLSREQFAGLYLQLSFRKFDQTPIVIDPIRVYYKITRENISADIVDVEMINKLFKKTKR